MAKPICILTADIHMTLNTPPCLPVPVGEVLNKNLYELSDLQFKTKLPVLDAGDVFDKAQNNDETVGCALDWLPKNFTTIAGNHDLPRHNHSLFYKSSLHTLAVAHEDRKVLEPYETIQKDCMSVTGLPYGCYDASKIDMDKVNKGKIKIALIHTLVVEERSGLDIEEITPSELLELFPMFDVIVSGHNHKHFIYKDNNRVVVNVGSMYQGKIGQKDYHPAMLILNDDLSIDYNYFTTKYELIDTKSITDKETNNRIRAFVSVLGKDVRVTFSFENNLTTLIKESIVKNTTKELVEELTTVE